MMAYWPWWAGALALGLITVAYQMFVGRRFGVSSAMERVVHWPVEREAERLDREVLANADAFAAALAAESQAEFGGTGIATAAPPDEVAPAPTRLPMSACLLLLVSIVVGAFITALINGRFAVRGDMGEAFSDIVVDGPMMWPVLFVGGVMVGIGTRMAGGCSSGHGMSGCSRFQPVSLLATSVFFGTAVIVSSLLYWVI